MPIVDSCSYILGQLSRKGKFCSVCAVTQVICLIYPSSRNTIFQLNHFHTPSADRIRTHVHIISPYLQVGQQEDVSEFLECLFEHYTTCLSLHLPMPDHLLSTPSIIDQIFSFTITVSARCSSCSHIYDKEESLNILFLEINNSKNISDALQHFVEEETLRKTVCVGCGQRGDIFKRVTLHKLPPVLIITFKRFQFSFQSTTKLLHQVNYGELLDVSPYMSHHFKTSRKNNQEMNSPHNHIYKLYATISHTGSDAHQGHYYSHIRSADDSWFLVNDANFQKISSNNVFNHSDTYVLFYAKISNASANNCSILQQENRSTAASPRENIGNIENVTSLLDYAVFLWFQSDKLSDRTVV